MNDNIIALDSSPTGLIFVITLLVVSIVLCWFFNKAHHRILAGIAGLFVVLFLVTTVAVAVGGTTGYVKTQGPVSPQLIPSAPS